MVIMGCGRDGHYDGCGGRDGAVAVHGHNRHRAVGGPGGHDDGGDCCGVGGSIEKEPKVKR